MKLAHPVYIVFIILVLTCGACSSFNVIKDNDFVKVSGTRLVLNRKTYYFLGSNFWYAAYLGASGELGDRNRLLLELDHLKSMGINNLRILGASQASYIKNNLTPAIQTRPYEYNENLLEGLDFLLSEMQKRDMKAVIFLNNNWEWSGGMSQFNDWSVDSSGFTPPYPDNNNFMNFSDSFYRNEKAKRIYYHYLYSLINRKNKYSGYYYYEDPAIMAWQLSNEPRPGTGNEGAKWLDEYYRWIDVTARYIHNLDPNHLVSSGSEGLAGSLDSAEVFKYAHSSKYIDYLTFHLWPYDWGWYKPDNVDSTYPVAEAKSFSYINKHIQLARELGKPIVMEEFGLPRDNSLTKPGTPITVKDKFFEKILSMVFDSVSAGTPIAGANFWFWGGEGNPDNYTYKWGFGNPLRGVDNFNSIYFSDTSTIKILKKYAGKLNGIKNEIPPRP
jgi:mannan endo-1,4-beta-mannosidase